jgi:hypothetical protein
MKATLAWYFKCDLHRRDDLKARLDSFSPTPWEKWDSDSGEDSLTNKITSHAWLQIYEFGMGGYVANLKVAAETEQELATQIELAKRKTFDEIFASVGARDIAVEEPYQR